MDGGGFVYNLIMAFWFIVFNIFVIGFELGLSWLISKFFKKNSFSIALKIMSIFLLILGVITIIVFADMVRTNSSFNSSDAMVPPYIAFVLPIFAWVYIPSGIIGLMVSKRYNKKNKNVN